MKKFAGLTAVITAIIMSFGTVYAYDFPQPDWGALLQERTEMVKETDFELYAEASPDKALNYGAKFEPAAGAYIGMSADTSEEFKPLGSYLTYIESFSQLDLYYPSNEMARSDNSVIMVGWTVNSLDDVDYDAVQKTCENLNAYGKKIFFRFANEMNCSQLGDEPDRYVEIFRNVANIAHQYPNLAVVWSPNDMGALDRPFEYYYPGNEYVDWVGVSCYTERKFQNNANTSESDSIYFMTGDYSWTTNKLKPLIDFMEKNNIEKPVMISEGAVARYDETGASYDGWHEPRLRNMLWNTIMKYPQVKMINYFNVHFDGYIGEQFSILNYPASIDIFKDAASSGAYLRSADDTPKFVFKPANDAGTLTADENGIIKLRTLAYFANQPNVTVTYRLDGNWFHSSDQIPYTCNLDVNSISDGAHTMTIATDTVSKDYAFTKNGNSISFGTAGGADMSVPAPNPAPENGISVIYNGNPIAFEQPPVIINDHTLVPLRAIFEAMNASVDWDDATKTVTSARGDITVLLTINDNILYKNGKGTEIEVPAQLVGDYTMIPVRAIAEAFGSNVEWIQETKTVVITE